MNLACPTCGKKGAWLEMDYAPFCSKRCKLIDLGKWFNEEHAISEPLRPDHFEEFLEEEKKSSFQSKDETESQD